MNNICKGNISAKYLTKLTNRIKTRFDDISEEIIRERQLRHEQQLKNLSREYFSQNTFKETVVGNNYKISEKYPELAKKLLINA